MRFINAPKNYAFYRQLLKEFSFELANISKNWSSHFRGFTVLYIKYEFEKWNISLVRYDFRWNYFTPSGTSENDIIFFEITIVRL